MKNSIKLILSLLLALVAMWTAINGHSIVSIFCCIVGIILNLPRRGI